MSKHHSSNFSRACKPVFQFCAMQRGRAINKKAHTRSAFENASKTVLARTAGLYISASCWHSDLYRWEVATLIQKESSCCAKSCNKSNALQTWFISFAQTPAGRNTESAKAAATACYLSSKQVLQRLLSGKLTLQNWLALVLPAGRHPSSKLLTA